MFHFHHTDTNTFLHVFLQLCLSYQQRIYFLMSAFNWIFFFNRWNFCPFLLFFFFFREISILFTYWAHVFICFKAGWGHWNSLCAFLLVEKWTNSSFFFSFFFGLNDRKMQCCQKWYSFLLFLALFSYEPSVDIYWTIESKHF